MGLTRRLLPPGRPRALAAILLFTVPAAALAALLYLQAPRSGFASGALYTLSRYEQAMALAGLGLVLAQLGARSIVPGLALLIAAIPLGSIAAAQVAAWATGATDAMLVLTALLAIGPVCAFTIGVAAISPRRARPALASLAALMLGASLGLAFDHGDRRQWAFAAGAILCGCWLVLAPLALCRTFAAPWLSIATHIYGGWLVAIGLLLGASLAIRM